MMGFGKAAEKEVYHGSRLDGRLLSAVTLLIKVCNGSADGCRGTSAVGVGSSPYLIVVVYVVARRSVGDVLSRKIYYWSHII